MSFFGGSSLGATSTPAKPGGLFSTFGGGAGTATPSFGAMPATTSATGFGAAAPFGAGGFGAPAATSAPTIGTFSGFGGATATTQSAFGGFATNTSTSATPSLFGTTTTNTTTGFGGFGGTAPTATSSAPSFSSFGAAAAPSGIGAGFSGFGGTHTTTTAAPAFGGFNAQAPGFGNFGGGNATFGSTFGKPATSTVTPGFGGFGGNTSFMLGQPQQIPPQISVDEAFAQSIFNVSIYGDERDTIIAKWNYLQAMWGTGKSFYSQNAPAVEITPENYLCRFKAIGYTRLPGKDNKMGLVGLSFNRPLSDVRNQQNQLIHVLNTILGNKPHLVVNIDANKEIGERKCQYVIYVEEKAQLPPNQTKRILATELANYLNQPAVRSQLANLGIYEVVSLVLPDEDQLKEYLENPPKGVDPRMWRQARLDNPDERQFIPVPMIGFNDLKTRMKSQENEIETHSLYLKKVEKELAELRQRHVAATAKIMEHKRKLAELSHKVLKIVVKQECTRKLGLPLSPEEEALRTKLENMQALVSAPTQFKGRLSELLSQMRMQRSQYALTGGSEYTIDKDCEEEMKSFLAMQQRAMEVLTETVTKDLKALQIISEGMPELTRS